MCRFNLLVGIVSAGARRPANSPANVLAGVGEKRRIKKHRYLLSKAAHLVIDEADDASRPLSPNHTEWLW